MENSYIHSFITNISVSESYNNDWNFQIINIVGENDWK